MKFFKRFDIKPVCHLSSRSGASASSLFSLPLAALLLGVTIVPTAQAGNGSGINGPDLAGISVPSLVDSSFLESDLDSTLRSCGEVALKPLADVLQNRGTQISFFSETTVVTSQNTSQVRHVSRTFKVEGTAIGSGRGSKNDNQPTCTVQFGDVGSQSPDFPTRLSISACSFGNGTYFSQEALPHYEYDISMNNVRFDEWGNPTSGKPAITQLHVFPLDSSAKMRFINPNSGQPISLTFNAAAMAACMKAQAQRAQ